MKYYRNFEAFITNKILKKKNLKKIAWIAARLHPGRNAFQPHSADDGALKIIPIQVEHRIALHNSPAGKFTRYRQAFGSRIFEINFVSNNLLSPFVHTAFPEQCCNFQHHLNFPPDSSGASLTLTTGGELKHFFGYDADCMFGQEGH